jgi:hypothetical protein
MEIKEMITRVVGFIGVTISGNLVKKLIQEIVKKFQN